MNWLVIASALAVVSVGCVAVSIQQVALSGTCASIGYSNTCCPPRINCQATDGNCHCGADCHKFGDCCMDAHCPSQPRTCADVGITRCCDNMNGVGSCDVYSRDAQNTHCSCNISCHLRNDCCSDALSIGCIPQTCAQAGKSPGCCTWSASTSCRVPRPNNSPCFCDQMCTQYNDCCDDVPDTVTCSTDSQMSRNTGIQSAYQSYRQRLREMYVQQIEEQKTLMSRIQNDNSGHIQYGVGSPTGIRPKGRMTF